MASIKPLIDQVSSELGITKTAAERVINSTFRAILSELEDSGQARLPGIGKLVLKVRPARTARNPRTGEAVEVPERTTVRLRVFPAAAEWFDFEKSDFKAGLTD